MGCETVAREVFDTYDADMHWTGTATRHEVHRLGLWHQTFHCWILHENAAGDFLVLQRRHRTKDTHPNLLDISAAGHLEAGETMADGVRELEEELGLAVVYGDLQQVGVYRYVDESGHVRDHEFCHLHVLIRPNAHLADYRPALGEVSGLYAVRLEDMQKLCLGPTQRIAAVGFDVDDTGQKTPMELQMARGDMVAFGTAYYEMLFQGIRESRRNAWKSC